MFNFFASWRREREAVRELSRLTDRELIDLGIGRSQIRDVVGSAPLDPMSRPPRDASGAMAPAWGAHLRRSIAA